MQMTSAKLIGLRLFNVTLGRTAWASRLLRRILVTLLISRKKHGDRYMASSRFFDPRELNRN
jgi:hypothetical protein